MLHSPKLMRSCCSFSSLSQVLVAWFTECWRTCRSVQLYLTTARACEEAKPSLSGENLQNKKHWGGWQVYKLKLAGLRDSCTSCKRQSCADCLRRRAWRVACAFTRAAKSVPRRKCVNNTEACGPATAFSPGPVAKCSPNASARS